MKGYLEGRFYSIIGQIKKCEWMHRNCQKVNISELRQTNIYFNVKKGDTVEYLKESQWSS